MPNISVQIHGNNNYNAATDYNIVSQAGETRTKTPNHSVSLSFNFTRTSAASPDLKVSISGYLWKLFAANNYGRDYTTGNWGGSDFSWYGYAMDVYFGVGPDENHILGGWKRFAGKGTTGHTRSAYTSDYAGYAVSDYTVTWDKSININVYLKVEGGCATPEPCKQGNYVGVVASFAVPAYNPATVPGAITNLTVSNGSATGSNIARDNLDESVILSWSAPNNGGSSILGYNLYYSVGSGWVRFLQTGSTSITTSIRQIYSSLPRGTTMSIMVRAYNSIGESSGTSNLVSVTFNNPRCYLDVISKTTTTFRVRWSSSYNTNIYVKKVEYSLDNTNWVSQTVDAYTGYIDISGRSPNTTYTLYVRITPKENPNGTISNNIKVQTNPAQLRGSVSSYNLTSVTIGWNCDVALSQMEYKLNTMSSYKVASTNINNTSGTFTINSLSYNTNYTIYLYGTIRSNGQKVSHSFTFKTLDIARITKYPTSWNLDSGGEIEVTLPNTSNTQYSLSLSYNNIDVVSRSNISFTNNKYTFTLNASEKLFIYSITGTDSNPKLTINLKTYVSSYIGTDSKVSSVTFNTKAWVKVNNVWKRALVYVKPSGSTWKTCDPWVKLGSTWKKI